MSQFLSLNINKREQFQIQKQMAILILFKYEGRRKVKAFYYIIPVLTPSRSQHNTALKLVCLVPKPCFLVHLRMHDENIWKIYDKLHFLKYIYIYIYKILVVSYRI